MATSGFIIMVAINDCNFGHIHTKCFNECGTLSINENKLNAFVLETEKDSNFLWIISVIKYYFLSFWFCFDDNNFSKFNRIRGSNLALTWL